MQVSADRQTAPEVEIPHMQACASGKGAGNQQTCRGDAPSPPDTPKALPEGRLRIDDVFGFREKLGHGQYGLVSRAVDKRSGEEVAIKVISKREIKHPQEDQDIKNEVAILKYLATEADGPITAKHLFTGIAHMKAVYEDKRNIYIVQELCTGGELLTHVIQHGHYTEHEAAKVFKQIMQCIAYLHERHIVHADLKPENFLLQNDQPDALLKIIDFGLSHFVQDGELLHERVGTPFYMAPEVIKRSYDNRADMWSAGVILYVLLSGKMPFAEETYQETYEAILSLEPDYDNEAFEFVTDSAKDLLRGLMQKDLSLRLSPLQVLSHPWLCGAAPQSELSRSVQKNLKRFKQANKLQRMSRLVFARKLMAEGEQECVKLVRQLREVFASMDLDGSGHITPAEFHHVLGPHLGTSSYTSHSEIADVLRSLDMHHHRRINYEQFLAAALDYNACMSKPKMDMYVADAFTHFDKDGDGLISIQDLEMACEDFNQLSVTGLHDILKSISPGQQKISLDQFQHMLQQSVATASDSTNGLSMPREGASCSQSTEQTSTLPNPLLRTKGNTRNSE